MGHGVDHFLIFQYNVRIMTPLQKRFLLVFATLLFFTLAPLTLFYARGDRYSFEEGLSATGGLFAVSQPAGATIIVDDTPSGLTKKFMPGLDPGSYIVAIEREGYRSWRKILDVEPYQVTQTGKVLLVPHSIGTSS